MYTLLCDKLLVGISIRVLNVLHTKRLYQIKFIPQLPEYTHE